MSKSFMAKLLVLLAGFILVPASTAQAAGSTGAAARHAVETGAETSSECSAALQDLHRTLVKVKSMLSAESPDKRAAIRMLREATTNVANAHADRCEFTKAEVSYAPATRDGRTEEAPVAYPELGLDILGGLLGTVTALVSGLVGGALGLVTGVLATVTKLLGIDLPIPPLPSPPLPSPPLPSVSVPAK